MGQSGLQNHYNPDRVTKPLLRKGGSLVEASWDEAMDAIKQKLGSSSKVAWFTGTVSGHQAVLLQAHLDAMGSKSHYVHEVVNTSVSQAVNREVLGEALPRYRFDQAKVILSFGADFLGPWQSPVHFSTKYAKFREAPRGILVQVEPKMTLTGGNADLWLAIRPGTEGVFALGIANLLLSKFNRDGSQLPAEVRSTIAKYDLDTVTNITGVPGDRLTKVATWLNERSPSLVLSGMSAEGQEHGYDTAAAAMLLNIILGNVGKTIVSSGAFPFSQLVAKEGNTGDLLAFADALDKGEHRRGVHLRDQSRFHRPRLPWPWATNWIKRRSRWCSPTSMTKRRCMPTWCCPSTRNMKSGAPMSPPIRATAASSAFNSR